MRATWARLCSIVFITMLMAAACGGDDTRGAPGEKNATTPVDESPMVAPETVSGAFFLDLRTAEMTPLAESLDGYFYPVSPDGTMFAYNPCCANGGVSVANVDGSGVREVTPDGVDAFMGSWSPDASLLVYQGRGQAHGGLIYGLGNLFVVDMPTEEVRQITDLGPRSNSWWYLSPIFSPDGQTIRFQLSRGSLADTRWDLWSVPVAGGESTLVRRDASMGAYSPDGGTLAYLDSPRETDGGGWSSSLWLADADGSDPRLLVDGDGDFVRWSPDGTRIVYAGDGKILVVDVATGESSHMADGGTAEWIDDDTLVVAPGRATE